MTDTIKEPPHSDDVERTLLGCVFIDPLTLNDIRQHLEPEDFYRESHRWLYRAVCDLQDEGDSIDAVSVCDWLDDAGKLDKVGGSNAVVRLSNAVPSAASYETYRDRVREKSDRRHLLQASRAVGHKIDSEAGYTSEDASAELMDAAQKVAASRTQTEDTTIRRHTKDLFRMMEAKNSGEKRVAIPTGMDAVDDVAQTSFSPGKLVGIAALPKMGKSRLAAAIAGHMVGEHGFTGSVWYTDGAGWHWPRDQIARLAGISTSKIDNPRMMGEHDWARVTAQVQAVKDWPVHIHARGRPHIRDIMLSTKQRLAENPDKTHVLVVDYVQNVTAGIRGDKRANVDAAIDGLRELRTDHPNLIILALMQFNRGASQKSIPSWTDLKESSTLEQALDSLFIFHRPAMLDDNASAEDKKKGILWLALTKFDEPKRKALRCDLARLAFDAYSGRDF